MGLVILPLLVGWVVGIGYTLYMFYSLVTSERTVVYALVALGTAILLSIIYANFSLSVFKGKESVWVFEIPIFFLLNKLAILVYTLAVTYKLWGQSLSQYSHMPAVCFILAFSISVGTCIGCVYSEIYVKNNNIKVTH